MKYPIRPEFEPYSWIRFPINPRLMKESKSAAPLLQKGRKLDERLTKRRIELPHCAAKLITPKEIEQPNLLIYCHGGAFMMKAAAYHKNLAQTYALGAACAVLLVDYRLAPKHKFPIPAEDCFDAYKWALRQGYPKIAIGGDSAGANLALAVAQLAHGEGLPLPAAQMLLYPAADSRMQTESMRKYVDTPLWDSVRNAEMYRLYAGEADWHNPLVSPMEAQDLSYLPPSYIETAEFDCLHDEGVALAQRLAAEGVAVALNETAGTIHGFDIAEESGYVQEQVEKRVAFLLKFMF